MDESLFWTEKRIQVFLGVEGEFPPGVLGRDGEKGVCTGERMKGDAIQVDEQVFVELLPGE
jgi:hypothetical protein